MYQQPVSAAQSPIPLSAHYRQQLLMVGELPNAFFSYARVDAEVVRLFARELDLAGIRVFLDLDFLRPGERFETAILAKVRSASALTFFASPSSLQSKWMSRGVFA